jgi:hypothetical protein
MTAVDRAICWYAHWAGRARWQRSRHSLAASRFPPVCDSARHPGNGYRHNPRSRSSAWWLAQNRLHRDQPAEFEKFQAGTRSAKSVPAPPPRGGSIRRRSRTAPQSPLRASRTGMSNRWSCSCRLQSHCCWLSSGDRVGNGKPACSDAGQRPPSKPRDNSQIALDGEAWRGSLRAAVAGRDLGGVSAGAKR